MVQMPPIPSWDGLHPLIIHFPIALLLVAPILILIGVMLNHTKGRSFLIAALLIMALGTASTFIAVSTGKAAGQLTERSSQVNAVLEQHEELAETTRIVFSALTVVFAALVFAQLLQREPSRLTTAALPLLFLVLYAGGAVLLINTAHNGGRLVHELGVTAVVAPSPDPPIRISGERND